MKVRVFEKDQDAGNQKIIKLGNSSLEELISNNRPDRLILSRIKNK
jgi:hypothetical protein